MVTGDNEAPNRIPEFLTRRIPSQTALQQSKTANNRSFDTTLAAPAPNATRALQDPINRLADAKTNSQNRPAAQQPFTIHTVNAANMKFGGKNEKFVLIEDVSHTINIMQLTMSEQKKINQFHSLLQKGALQIFRYINSINRNLSMTY